MIEMTITTYKMNKTLKQASSGESVDAVDFINAIHEKKERKARKNKAFRRILQSTIKQMKEEEERNKEFKDTLERKLKFCPKCGYKTIVEHHKLLCVRKCLQCNWKSNPWKKPTNDNPFLI